MTISYNGFTCEEMYGEQCQPVLEAVRMGTAHYECKCCGSLTVGSWPPNDEEQSE